MLLQQPRETEIKGIWIAKTIQVAQQKKLMQPTMMNQTNLRFMKQIEIKKNINLNYSQIDKTCKSSNNQEINS